MFNSVPEEVKEDSTPEFRKCWALGEAFYYVKSYFERNSEKDFYYTKTKLEAIIPYQRIWGWKMKTYTPS